VTVLKYGEIEMKGLKYYLSDMNISKKLKVSYFLLIALTAVLAIVSVIGLFSLERNLKTIVTGPEKADSAIKQCRIDTNVAARTVREMALAKDKSTLGTYKVTFEDTLTDTNEQLKTIKESGVVSEKAYNEYVATFTSWANDAYDIVTKLEAGQTEQATSLIFSQCVPALNNLVQLAQTMNDEIDVAVDSAIMKARITFWVCFGVVILMTALAILAAVAISKSVQNAILTPLGEIEDCASELAKGNLSDNTVDYDTNDEFGQVAGNLKNAIATLNSYVQDITYTMGEFAQGHFEVQQTVEWKGDFVEIYDSFKSFEKTMAETVHSIQRVAKEVDADAAQVSSTSMELAQGATDQASVMEEFTATIETVSNQVSNNAEYTKKISRQVESVGGEIQATTDMMNEMVESMNEIEKSSQQISKIIDTISDVASQTSLLALNASIEAARAGESGRGFAVVANQVTELAAKTADAVKESAKLIDSSIAEVSKGMQITKDISLQQNTVSENAKSIVEEVNNVAETLDAQKESFMQLNEGVNQINGVVQSNSATSQQCAASSQEMSGQAEALEKLIAKFRVAQG
jgi:methyl-accepting chemotaxis protein